jgi:hypothetical protein
MSLTRNGFQTFVNRNPAPAVIGDFASMNPRASWLAGEGQFRAAGTLNYLSAVNSPVVGNFAWGQGQLAYGQKPAGASVLGFIANELQTVIPFLAPGAGVNPVRLAVESGFGVTGFTHGDFWTIPAGAVAGIVSPGDVVYARQYDGAATNDPVAFEGTASQATTVLTVSAVAKGALVPGMIVDSSGADATVIVQLTGTPGGIGTYTVSTSATVGSGTVTVAAVNTGYLWQSATVADAAFTGVLAAGTGVLTTSAVTGTISVGQHISGVGVPANLFITAQLTGTPGGAGTYQLNTIGPAIGSVAMTSTEGKLAKISRTY